MRYARIQREDAEGFITIGEYIFKTDPETFKQLHRTYLIKHGIGQYLSKPMDELLLNNGNIYEKYDGASKAAHDRTTQAWAWRIIIWGSRGGFMGR